MGIRSKMQADLEENIVLYIVLLIAYTISATSGAFSLSALPDAMKLQVVKYASDSISAIKGSSIAYISVLVFALAQHFICIFSIMIGKRRLFWPIGILSICACGIIAGFSARTIIVAFSFSGVAISLLCIWIPELILLPCRMRLCSLAREHQQYKNTCPNRIKRENALCVLMSLAGIGWQTFLAPLLIRRFL